MSCYGISPYSAFEAYPHRIPRNRVRVSGNGVSGSIAVNQAVERPNGGSAVVCAECGDPMPVLSGECIEAHPNHCCDCYEALTS